MRRLASPGSAPFLHFSITVRDANGNRIKVVEGGTGKLINRLWYDADGHVQSHTADGNSEFNLIVNGQMYGVESGKQELALGSNYLAVTSPSLTAAPSSYSVQSSSETLQSIAQNVWGDANLWYLIADANSLGSDAKLTVGQILRIPTRSNTIHGDYETFKPYDPSEQIGNTAPAMPAPQSKGGGCGGLGQLVMVVVAVAVTVYTGYAAAGWLQSVAGGSALGGSVATGAVASAAGSIASQAVGIAIGAQDGFNWKSVATAAIGGAVTGGVASMTDSGTLSSVFKGQSWQAVAARAALSNTVSQGVGIVTGLQNGFDWRSVAASAAGAGVGAKATGYLNGSSSLAQLFKGSDIARATVSAFAAGTTTAVARGGKVSVVRIASDAFGNALGNSLGKR